MRFKYSFDFTIIYFILFLVSLSLRYMCDITNIFAGPVIIYPKPKGKWEVPNLPEIKIFYTKIVGLDRVAIFNSVF